MTLKVSAIEDSLEKYRVYSKREIAAILRSLGEKKQMIRMVFRQSEDGAVTSVLYIDPTHNQVVLDRTNSEKINQKILHANGVEFEAVLDKIKIFFIAEHVHDCFYEDKPAFLIDLPDDLLRLQRREYYRVMTYRGRVRVPVGTPGGTVVIETTLRDFSAGGICMIDESMKLGSEYGKVYHGCQVFLPDIQPITVSLQVRNSHIMAEGESRTYVRLGCQFVEISNAESALIQRCITKMERERADPFWDDA